MEAMIFGLVLFIGTAFHDDISELIRSIAAWLRSRSEKR